jgi:hypothetical protein
MHRVRYQLEGFHFHCPQPWAVVHLVCTMLYILKSLIERKGRKERWIYMSCFTWMAAICRLMEGFEFTS